MIRSNFGKKQYEVIRLLARQILSETYDFSHIIAAMKKDREYAGLYVTLSGKIYVHTTKGNVYPSGINPQLTDIYVCPFINFNAMSAGDGDLDFEKTLRYFKRRVSNY